MNLKRKANDDMTDHTTPKKRKIETDLERNSEVCTVTPESIHLVTTRIYRFPGKRLHIGLGVHVFFSCDDAKEAAPTLFAAALRKETPLLEKPRGGEETQTESPRETPSDLDLALEAYADTWELYDESRAAFAWGGSATCTITNPWHGTELLELPVWLFLNPADRLEGRRRERRGR
jgi:hypothetical protein